MKMKMKMKKKSLRPLDFAFVFVFFSLICLFVCVFLLGLRLYAVRCFWCFFVFFIFIFYCVARCVDGHFGSTSRRFRARFVISFSFCFVFSLFFWFLFCSVHRFRRSLPSSPIRPEEKEKIKNKQNQNGSNQLKPVKTRQIRYCVQ